MTAVASESAAVEFWDGDEASIEPAPLPSSPAAVHQVLEETAADLDGPEEPELPAERERTLRAPGFTRMPVSWSPEHAPVIAQINAMAAGRIQADFADLFEIVAEIEDAAREAGADRSTGEIGRPDFAAIPQSRKENWVLLLSVRLVGWEQRAAAYWGEAMLGKVIRQEVFTGGYLGHSGRSTIEDRTQAGHQASLQEYYHAVLCALLHKHAAAACASAERLCQRLKDVVGR